MKIAFQVPATFEGAIGGAAQAVATVTIDVFAHTLSVSYLEGEGIMQATRVHEYKLVEATKQG
jgi:hypothetical protein